MSSFAFAWALLIGAIATICIDWRTSIPSLRPIPLFNFVALAVGMPILWYLANAASVEAPQVKELAYRNGLNFICGFVGIGTIRWMLNTSSIMCRLGWHREVLVEEFPSDVTTILGVECEHCHTARCTLNARLPRHPTEQYDASVEQAKNWLRNRKASSLSIWFR